MSVISASSICSALLTMISLNSNVKGNVAMAFSHQSRLADNAINVRYAKEPNGNGQLVLVIPGGPGISGKYLDAFTLELSRRLEQSDVAILDLPHHDASRVAGRTENLTYPEVRELMVKAVAELAAQNKSIVLVGHSLGALIAMDLVAHSPIKFEKVVLADIPTTFDVSKEFSDGLRKAGVADEVAWPTEQSFSVWWGKIIPLYFKRQPTAEEVALLNSETYWLGNERFTDNAPAFALLAKSFETKGVIERTYYLEGERDLLPPDGNFQTVKAALPGVKAELIADTGHFPMLEAPELTVEKVVNFIKF